MLAMLVCHYNLPIVRILCPDLTQHCHLYQPQNDCTERYVHHALIIILEYHMHSRLTTSHHCGLYQEIWPISTLNCLDITKTGVHISAGPGIDVTDMTDCYNTHTCTLRVKNCIQGLRVRYTVLGSIIQRFYCNYRPIVGKKNI